MRVTVIGAGVAGLACALELAGRGCAVEVVDRTPKLGVGCCSWFAGGMLSPWCELESAEPLIAELGAEALVRWGAWIPDLARRGSLVVAPGRDLPDLRRFARRTERYEWADTERIRVLEPGLEGRFPTGLYFPDEAHLDPREALATLARRLGRLNVPVRFGVDAGTAGIDADRVVDCRGLAAGDVLPDLRGVKGEMLLIRSRDILLSRPVRLLHPRIPLYIVPRADGVHMVGATMIETEERQRITARSMLELLSAAYALHPAFGEAEILEIGVDARPAFPDNLPRLRWRGGRLHVNGLYRHGFLLAPSLARMAADVLLKDAHFPEVMDEGSGERRSA